MCHGGQQKGKAVSIQRLAQWIVDAVALAYQSQGEPCPLGVRAHSTRSVASSYALAQWRQAPSGREKMVQIKRSVRPEYVVGMQRLTGFTINRALKCHG